MQKASFIGFGEAAQAFVEGWGSGEGLRAFDLKTDDAAEAAAKRADYKRLGVDGRDDRGSALAGADAVFCTVTADRALDAARECAPHLGEGAFWFDMNSCAPSSKRAASEVIDAVGGRYVDVAVMAPVYPKRHLVPLLIAGPHAAEAEEALKARGMNPRVVEGEIGAASTIKMLRSIMVKGMEALTSECVLAAVKAGVDEEVLGSLDKSFPGFKWSEQSAYNFERVMVHGVRRAAEMREVAKTVADLGLPPDMASATVEWHQRIGELKARPDDEAGWKDHRGLAHLLLASLGVA